MAPSEVSHTVSIGRDEQQQHSIVQEGVKARDLHTGHVSLLDGRQLSFQISKHAEGEVLFNLITDAIGLMEKDYFGLAYYDNPSVRKWLLKNKKISKQVKELPWEFSLEVKFYTPDPSQLAEDFTRHMLALQLRTDIYNGKLPASLMNQAHLGSLIAQAELGDYTPGKSYTEALKALSIVPGFTEELEEKIIQLYKEQKGKTPPEAELSFLMACRELILYGMMTFTAHHNNKVVRIGINSAGISVFQEHLRQHYILWQSMHQLEYQRKSFTVKLKNGEKEGKKTLVFKLDDEPITKLCWRTAVEHHTFFRLMQPEDKANRSLFQLGSGRFRPEGRTHFQTKMASQMFDGTPTAGPQISSARTVSHSSDNVSTEKVVSTPLNYVDERSNDGNSPHKSYTLHAEDSTSPHSSSRAEEFSKGKKSKQKDASSSSSDSEVEVEERRVLREHNRVFTEDSNDHYPSPAKMVLNHSANERPDAAARPYTPANDKEHGPVIRQERVECVYRITGSGAPPTIDPADPTLLNTFTKCVQENEELPRVKLVASQLEIEQTDPAPSLQKQEAAAPHTTLQTWHESNSGPEQVVTEVDEHGNVVKKTIKTSHEKHTVQKQSYQTFTVAGQNEPAVSNTIEQTLDSIAGINSPIPSGAPAAHAQTRVLVYGKDGDLQDDSSALEDDQIVSSKVVTTGNRTIETITYTTVKNGVAETNVEHRVTIQGPEVDHEAELRRAIIEATGLNPRYEVQRVEVKQERLA